MSSTLEDGLGVRSDLARSPTEFQEQTLEAQVRVLTGDVEAIKRRLRQMDDREATESALVVAARSDSLQVRELIPKIDDGVRALRVELKSEIGDVRNDLDEFRAEFSGFRAEVNDRFAEVNDRFAEVNTRIDTGLSGLRTEIKAELSEHREMLQRITAHLGI